MHLKSQSHNTTHRRANRALTMTTDRNIPVATTAARAVVCIVALLLGRRMQRSRAARAIVCIVALLLALLPMSGDAQTTPATGERITSTQAGITLNTQVYTISNSAQGGLCATTAGLTNNNRAAAAEATDANKQFVFITDGTDDSRVYLWSVGQKKYVEGVSAERTQPLSEGRWNPISFYQSGDANYPLSLAFSSTSTWTTQNSNGQGVLNLSVNNNGVDVNTYNRLQAETRFQVKAVPTHPSPTPTLPLPVST